MCNVKVKMVGKNSFKEVNYPAVNGWVMTVKMMSEREKRC